ncbi:MAG: hypothetical protein BWK74_08285 [Desulfobacteraceae bacterium A6]|nr:MAG: hypothetical protein BWK74_08285 [Desulfobacteraceae bacterium A6]
MAIKFHTCERKSRYIFTVVEKYPFSNLLKEIRFLDRINRPALARLLYGMLDTGKARSGPGIDRILPAGRKQREASILSFLSSDTS